MYLMEVTNLCVIHGKSVGIYAKVITLPMRFYGDNDLDHRDKNEEKAAFNDVE